MIIPGFGPGIGGFVSGTGGEVEITGQFVTRDSEILVPATASVGDLAIFFESSTKDTPPSVRSGWTEIFTYVGVSTTSIASSKILAAGDFDADLTTGSGAYNHRGITTVGFPAGLTPATSGATYSDVAVGNEIGLSVGGSPYPGIKMFFGATNAVFTLTHSNPDEWDLFATNFRTFFATKIFPSAIPAENATLASTNILIFAGLNISFLEV